MSVQTIDVGQMQRAFLAAANSLDAKKELINELNVFPVPDGDTGTNMTMTIMAAAREVAMLSEPTVGDLCRAISSGSLRGARGNSGVILSQLFRGFTRELEKAENIDVRVLSDAFVRATETAYKAVMKPKEGTILTVAKGMSEKAVELSEQTDDIIEFFKEIIEEGDAILGRTPELLPVLKQAGVVDSGGQGLMQVVKGALNGLLGQDMGLLEPFCPEGIQKMATVANDAGTGSGIRMAARAEAVEIKFGYCTEYIINLECPYDEAKEQEFRSYLEGIGDCVVVVSDDGIVKVHVHTNDPGLAIQKALSYGSLSRIKIDNMREEHEERVIQGAEIIAARQKKEAGAFSQGQAEDNPRKAYGFIAVSAGDGLAEIFKGIGTDCLIEGGQTMNPSTQDMLNAIEKVDADTIYIFPNNKNIILSAEQAKSMVKDKKVIVVPSCTVPQGITALIHFTPDLSPEDNLRAMEEEMSDVKTGQVTYAVRNTTVGGMEIHEGDIIGIGDEGILAVGQSIERVALKSLLEMVDGESELISIYYGSGIKEEDAQSFLNKVKDACPECEAELQNGGQPVYYYLMSVE